MAQERTPSNPGSNAGAEMGQAGGAGRSHDRRPERENDMRTGGSTESMRDRAGEMASEAGGMMQERAAELGSQASDSMYSAVESGREGAAEALEGGSERLRAMGGEGMAGMASGMAADGMRETAGYLREHDTSQIWEDVEQYVQRYPGRSVIAAIAAGVIVGRILR
jgi:hypothetical protein